jgi:N-formylglutamate amidohydrolase
VITALHNNSKLQGTISIQRLLTRYLVVGLLTTLLLPAGCDLFAPEKEESVYLPGESYFGENNYIEYVAGDLPIILSAPHGGLLTPDDIPDRTYGSRGRDRNTQELARSIISAIHNRTGGYPHIIINRLHRIKLDANREIVEAAQGSADSEQAWHDYHDFIETAKQKVIDEYGSGFYMDLHGHGHEIQRLELGYLLSRADLALTDAALNAQSYVNKSSIRTLVEESGLTLSELIRGPGSIGTILETLGYPSVPSSDQPNPGDDPYYTGGYNTQRHGSRNGGHISGLQIECNYTGVRNTSSNRIVFSQALAEALEIFIENVYGLDLQAGPPQ